MAVMLAAFTDTRAHKHCLRSLQCGHQSTQQIPISIETKHPCTKCADWMLIFYSSKKWCIAVRVHSSQHCTGYSARGTTATGTRQTDLKGLSPSSSTYVHFSLTFLLLL